MRTGVTLLALSLALGCTKSDEPDDNAAGSGRANAAGTSGSEDRAGISGDAPSAGSNAAASGKASSGDSGVTEDAASDSSSDSPVPDGGTQAQAIRCPQLEPTDRTATEEVHFHHVHMNTHDLDADLAFYADLLGASTLEYCTDEDGNGATRAARTDRGYLLFTEVDEPPDPMLNTYLEHIGWVHPTPATEIERLAMLDAPFWPEERNQCASAAAGMRACPIGMGTYPDYYFYLQAPNGARVEIAKGPGPASMGFGHVHLIMGVDLTFFATVSNGAYAMSAIDLVNHIDVTLTEDRLAALTVVDTRGKPIDHLAYSTSNLEATAERLEAAGIEIAEPISFKPEYGFRSFFVREAKGVWLELVEAPAFGTE